MLKVFYQTFPNTHLVSRREKRNLKLSLETQGIEVVDNVDDCDIYIVKAFSKNWNEIKDIKQPKGQDMKQPPR